MAGGGVEAVENAGAADGEDVVAVDGGGGTGAFATLPLKEAGLVGVGPQELSGKGVVTGDKFSRTALFLSEGLLSDNSEGGPSAADGLTPEKSGRVDGPIGGEAGIADGAIAGGAEELGNIGDEGGEIGAMRSGADGGGGRGKDGGGAGGFPDQPRLAGAIEGTIHFDELGKDAATEEDDGGGQQAGTPGKAGEKDEPEEIQGDCQNEEATGDPGLDVAFQFGFEVNSNEDYGGQRAKGGGYPEAMVAGGHGERSVVSG